MSEAALLEKTIAPRKRRRTSKVVPDVAAAPERPEAIQARTPMKRVRIILENNSAIPKTGQFFGVNGYTAYLKPGFEANVPVALLSVLEDAHEDIAVRNDDTLQIDGWRRQYRFPFRVLGEPK